MSNKLIFLTYEHQPPVIYIHDAPIYPACLFFLIHDAPIIVVPFITLLHRTCYTSPCTHLIVACMHIYNIRTLHVYFSYTYNVIPLRQGDNLLPESTGLRG
jgi:hypothetical protein